MNGRDDLADVAIIGAGRMGKGLALALTTRGRKAAVFGRDWQPSVVRQARLILIAVPDDAIRSVAADLAVRGAVATDHTVLHLSGLLDRNALASLAASGAARGSFHPLQSISDPAQAPHDLAGVYVGIEGDPRALAAAEVLAAMLDMIPVRITAEGKPAYHAAATIVSNYTVTLWDIAQRVARDAGIAEDVAAKLYLPLLRGTVTNLTIGSTAAALTGPVRRGDVGTIRAHLNALESGDRELYRRLALETLKLAARAGLDAAQVSRVEELLVTTA